MSAPITQSEIHDVKTIGEIEATVQYTVLGASTEKSVLKVVRTDGQPMTPDEIAFATEYVYTARNRRRG